MVEVGESVSGWPGAVGAAVTVMGHYRMETVQRVCRMWNLHGRLREGRRRGVRRQGG